MITKMTKYSFILLSEETEGFLTRIQELGVVDITRSRKPIDAGSSAMLEESSVVRKAMNLLRNTDYSKDPELEAIKEAASGYTVSGNPVEEALAAAGRLDELKSELSAANKELKSRRPWGDFDADAIKGLADKGYRVRFYCTPRNKFGKDWEQLYPLQVISDDSTYVWFVTVTPDDAEYHFPIKETAVPSGDWRESEAKIEALRSEMIQCKGRLTRLKESLGDISKEYDAMLSELDLYLARSADDKAVEEMVSVFTGFAPTEDDGTLTKAFDSMDVFYTKEEAREEDNPPIKLKNNWFARQFEVLTGMYGMPVYGEFDPTPILAPFFLLFFSMCMGDAGYGILLIIIGMFLKYKMADSGLGKMHSLVTFLGIGTLVIGLFLGTFFGISILNASWTPEWLKAMSVDGWFPDGKIAGFPVQMVFAVGIGVFHICLAMIVKSIGYTRRFGFGSTISTWGWTLLIVGGIVLAALGMMEVMTPEVMKWTVIALAVVSGLAIFIFNTPGRNPLKNIGSGLWDTYNMVTGLLGDVLSYIRLYALGLAGGMLGNAFNIMGTMLLDLPVPVANWIFCIIVLIFGHVLNLAMSCLGAFVHPLRLTFVEYFKNSGYEGKGVEYKPLKVSEK